MKKLLVVIGLIIIVCLAIFGAWVSGVLIVKTFAFYEDYKIIVYDNNTHCMEVLSDQDKCDKALGSYTGTTTQFEEWKPDMRYVIKKSAYDNHDPEPVYLYMTAEQSQKDHDDFIYLKENKEPETITIEGIVYDKDTIMNFLSTLNTIQ